MPQEDDGTAEEEESEIILSLPLPPRGDSSKLLQPGEEAFDLPATSVPTERATILLALAVGLDRCDELDVALMVQRPHMFGAVPGLVADQSRGQLSHERSIERSVGEYDVVSVSSRNSDREWKTIAVCDCHDLGRLACATTPDLCAPLFAGT